MPAQQIFPSHPQWNYIKFRVQLLIAQSNIQLLQVTKIPIDFEQSYEASFKIDAAIDATSLSQQKIQSFRVRSNRTSLFQSGYLQQQQDQGEHRILLFKLAIGRTTAVYKDASSLLDLGFPEDSDTIYFSDQQQELSLFNHQYKVKHPRQYSMEYDVIYKFSERVKFDPMRETCDYCRQNVAEVYCIQDKEFFCKICYDETHRSQLKAQHKSQPVTPYNSVPICPIPSHLQARKNVYCFQCQQIRCQTCMAKDHTDKRHQSMDIHEMAQMFADKQKSILHEIKNKLISQIKNAEKKIEIINSQYEFKERELEERFSIKLEKLRAEATKQISYAVGLHIQLRRKYDEYLWVQKFIEHGENTLPTEQNIKMKEAFTLYIEANSGKQNFLRMDKIINSL